MLTKVDCMPKQVKVLYNIVCCEHIWLLCVECLLVLHVTAKMQALSQIKLRM